jgi:response regulator of citrate/malate metabolism
VLGTVSPSKPLPKGLSNETAELVEDVLRAATSDLSATECATLAGLSRISARRYLEFFAETGRVKVRLRYGAGRPERRYRWSAS